MQRFIRGNATFLKASILVDYACQVPSVEANFINEMLIGKIVSFRLLRTELISLYIWTHDYIFLIISNLHLFFQEIKIRISKRFILTNKI